MSVHYYANGQSGAPALTGQAGSLIAVLKACLVDGFGDQEPLGWESVLNADETRALFRSADPASTQIWTCFDDTGNWNSARDCAVGGAEAWADPVFNADGTFNTANATNRFAWMIPAAKSSTLDATARGWRLIGDERGFYLCTRADGSNQHHIFHYGDLISYFPSDRYHYVILGGVNWNIGSYKGPQLSEFHKLGTTTGSRHYLARPYTQIAGVVSSCTCFADGAAGTEMGAALSLGNMTFRFPSPIDGGLHLSPIRWAEPAGIRGILPGAYAPLHQRPTPNGQYITGVEGLGPDRALLGMYIPSNNGGSGDDVSGMTYIDTTGPWR